MDIKMYEKPVMTKFVTINGEEFELGELFGCLSEIKNTKENDSFGDYSLREYELSYPEAMVKLVKLGFVKNYTGSRMANLFCMRNTKAIEELEATLYEMCD